MVHLGAAQQALQTLQTLRTLRTLHSRGLSRSRAASVTDVTDVTDVTGVTLTWFISEPERRWWLTVLIQTIATAAVIKVSNEMPNAQRIDGWTARMALIACRVTQSRKRNGSVTEA